MPTQQLQQQPARWLLLVHNIPPKPPYFRAKIGRKLQAAGAVAIKNSVYILPQGDETRHAFQWILKEINEGGGEASLYAANLVEGLSDGQVEAIFNAARDAEYSELCDELRKLAKRKKVATGELAKLKSRFTKIGEIDFFGAPGSQAAQVLLSELLSRSRLSGPAKPHSRGTVPLSELQGKIWVTRRGIHVDRIASAWLIRRFIDPVAKFKFIDGKAHEPSPGELRFDMVEAEFTHEGDSCSFETLLDRTGLRDSALREIAEIIHELDIGDGKFPRADIEGIGALINGICMGNKEDFARLERGSALLEDLYRYFRRNRK